MGRFLSLEQPPKKLSRNIGTVGVKETVDDNIIVTPDQLNTFFASPTVTRPSTNNVDPGRNPRNVEFAFAAMFGFQCNI
jgi:hypothetical protein